MLHQWHSSQNLHLAAFSCMVTKWYQKHRSDNGEKKEQTCLLNPLSTLVVLSCEAGKDCCQRHFHTSCVTERGESTWNETIHCCRSAGSRRFASLCERRTFCACLERWVGVLLYLNAVDQNCGAPHSVTGSGHHSPGACIGTSGVRWETRFGLLYLNPPESEDHVRFK